MGSSVKVDRREGTQTATKLDAVQIRLFDLMGDPDPDKWWTGDAVATLLDWYARTMRTYAASGCDPNELRRALRDLPEAAILGFQEWIETTQDMIGDRGRLHDPRTEADIATMRGEIAACEGLLKRLDAGRVRLFEFARGEE